MEFWHHFWMSGFWLFPLLMIVVMLVCIFVCARWLLGSRVGPGCCGPRESGEPHKSALDIARRRYAAGEISREELEEIKKGLL